MAPNTTKQSLVHDGRNAVGAGDIAVFVLANILSAFADMADTVAAELFGLFRFQAPVIERIFDLTDALTTVVASENLRHQRPRAGLGAARRLHPHGDGDFPQQG